MKPGFFKILIECCKGPGIYFQLLRQSPLTALSHFLLLSLLCTLVAALFNFPESRVGINGAFDQIRKSCGDIVITDHGIFPKKQPEESRLVFSKDQLELNYIADPAGTLPDFDYNSQMGIFWLPRGIVFWKYMGQDNDKKYWLIPALGINGKNTMVAKDDIPGYLRDNYPAKFEKKQWAGVSLDTIQSTVKIGLAIWSFVGVFFMYIIQFLLLILMISAIFPLIGSIRLKGKLSFRDYFVLCVYIAFPCMIIAMLSLIVKVQYVTFDRVAIITFAIYFMIVMTRIERWLVPPPKPDESELGD